MQVATQYWTVLLPLPALYLALGLDGVGAWLAHRARSERAWFGAGGAAVALALVWAGSYGALLGAVDAGAGGEAFGVPLSRWQETLAATRELGGAPGHPGGAGRGGWHRSRLR